MPLVPTLRGARVTLRRLEPADVDALWAVGTDPQVWRFLTRAVTDRDGLDAWVEERCAPLAEGRALPFCQCLTETGRPVGSTSLFDIDTKNRRAEIGHTWLAPAWWGTGINVEAKGMLLGHAFDTLGLHRVQIKTGARNTRARTATLRLGAKREGVLRRHDVLPDGHVRDAVVYSILDEEWPQVRAALDLRLGRPPVAPRRPWHRSRCPSYH